MCCLNFFCDCLFAFPTVLATSIVAGGFRDAKVAPVQAPSSVSMGNVQPLLVRVRGIFSPVLLSSR